MARKKLKRDEIVTEVRDRFARAQEHWNPIYSLCREDMNFSDPTDPKQWDEKDLQSRKNAEGGARPCLVFDQTQQFVRQVCNAARKNRPALNFLPVDDKSDPRLADVLKGLARQTEYESRADVAYIHALQQAVRGGIGFFRMVVEDQPGSEVKGQKCAKILRVADFESILCDPDYAEPDGSDMQWAIVHDTIGREAFKRKWPDAAEVSFDGADGWGTKDSIRIVEYLKLAEVEGKKVIEWRTMNGEEVLEETTIPCSHVPVFPVVGNEEWEKGKRRIAGAVRLAKDPQRSYNYERNAGFEAVALAPKAPWLAAAEAIEGYEEHWKQANRGNLAYLPWNSLDDSGQATIPAPSRIAPAQMVSGWADLAERSKADIQASLGHYEASAGANPNSQSGRAVIALQEKADIGTYHYIDNLAHAIAHCGRVLTEIWPAIYDQAQVIRIIGEDDEPSFVRVDPTLPRPYAEQPGQSGHEIIINPGIGRYDVRAVVGPAYSTRQAEAAAEIGELVNGNPQLMALLGDVWVKMRNVPDADKISRRLQALLPPEVRAQEQGEQQLPPQVVQVLQQAQQEIQQLQQALQEAQSGMALKQFEAQVQTKIESEREMTKRYIAELNADAAQDREELKGLVQLLIQQMQPPPQLAQEVFQDMSE
jgi:hypothetical protein